MIAYRPGGSSALSFHQEKEVRSKYSMDCMLLFLLPHLFLSYLFEFEFYFIIMNFFLSLVILMTSIVSIPFPLENYFKNRMMN